MAAMLSPRKLLTVLGVAVALTAGAMPAGEPLSSWGKGPVQFLMTREEAASWKSAGGDAAMSAFIDAFWLRRDPTPGTPVNEFRDDFESRVRYADEHFGTPRLRGSLSDRGKILILFGAPSSITRHVLDTRDSFAGAVIGSEAEGGKRETWTYKGPAATEAFGVPQTEVIFEEGLQVGDFRLVRGTDVAAAQQKVITTTIARAAAAPVPAPPPPVRPFTTSAYTDAIAQAKSGKSALVKPGVFWGEYATGSGERFAAVQLYFPKQAAAALTGELTFFASIENAAGKPVAVYEEPAHLTATKNDFYFEKSLRVPDGRHVGYFGMAANGKPVALVSSDMNVGSGAASTPLSALILSNDIYSMTRAQEPTEPFAFGGVKVVPKGDKSFLKADDLWYFFELRNPGIDEKTAGPRLQVRIELHGITREGKKVERLSPYAEVQAQALKGVPGHFGIGTSMSLSGFNPGEYTIKLRVTDTVTKQSYDLQDNFKIIG